MMLETTNSKKQVFQVFFFTWNHQMYAGYLILKSDQYRSFLITRPLNLIVLSCHSQFGYHIIHVVSQFLLIFEVCSFNRIFLWQTMQMQICMIRFRAFYFDRSSITDKSSKDKFALFVTLAHMPDAIYKYPVISIQSCFDTNEKSFRY